MVDPKISAGVELIPGGNHRLDWVSTYPFRVRCGLDGAGRDGHLTSRGDIGIGNDVWIGRGALILSGVSIGDGAVQWLRPAPLWRVTCLRMRLLRGTPGV